MLFARRRRREALWPMRLPRFTDSLAEKVREGLIAEVGPGPVLAAHRVRDRRLFRRRPGRRCWRGRKVQATLHWVSAADSVPAEVRLYNPVFTRPDPAGNFAADLNPESVDGRGADGLPA